MAPEAHLVDEVPVEAHDVGVGWLATEDGVVSCSPNG
jgi:5-formyltetrahydrofolate cyclo-ligase